MRDRMKGKVAIVSGGASGGGAAFRGGRRCGGHHRPQRATGTGLAFELAQQGHRVIFAGADVSKKAEVEAAVEIVRQQLGPVNVLFNMPAPSSSNPSRKPKRRPGTSFSM